LNPKQLKIFRSVSACTFKPSSFWKTYKFDHWVATSP